MATEMSLICTILGGVLFVMLAMFIVLGLLLHHKKGLNTLNMEVRVMKQNQDQQRRSTQRKNQKKGGDDGYLLPDEIISPNIPPKGSNPSDPSPHTYLHLAEKPYETINPDSDSDLDDDSGHLYESVEKLQAQTSFMR